MLLQRTVEYAARLPDIPPPMYQELAVRYVIQLDRAGRYLGMIDTADSSSPRSKTGARFLIPNVVRTSGIRPMLLVDKGSYVLGAKAATAAEGRERREHEAFVELARACAQATGSPEVRSVVGFLDSFSLPELSLPPAYDPEARVTFRVDDVLPVDLAAVRSYWLSVCRPQREHEMECLVCGLGRPPAKVHPVPIKRLQGGQTSGNFIVSANARAFESYGLRGSLIAPTCEPCAEAYGNGLNRLLAEESTSLRIGAVTFAFWTRTPTGFSPKQLLSAPGPEEVRELMRAPMTAAAAAVDLDSVAFYAVSLSASGSRVAVRSWLDSTVGDAKASLRRWFDLQSVPDAYGDEGRPLSLWSLATAMVRRGGNEKPPDRAVDGLFRLALGGTSPPEELLFAAVRRNRAEQGVTRERAALIKLVLGARPELVGGRDVTERLDLANDNPAYLCGRLLAVLDAIQRRALNNPNATIVDKFYGTASSAPASVFGTLLHGAQPHLAKQRKDERGKGAGRALEERLEQVVAGLRTFPPTLTLPQQGLFALGFYHQRAEDRRAAKEGAARRRDAAAVAEAGSGDGEVEVDAEVADEGDADGTG